MAVDVTSPSVTTFGFLKNATSADASGCEEIMAAPGSGKNITIDQIVIHTDSAISITIGEGETAGAVTTALLGPITFAVNGVLPITFNPPMKLTANTSLTVDASGAGNVCVVVQGKVK